MIDPKHSNVIALWDVPTVKGIGDRKQVDTVRLSLMLDAYSKDVELAVIEDVHSSPHDGHVGAFSFGKTTGILIGVVATLLIPTFFTPPAVWKNCFGLSKNKSDSFSLATKKFPGSAHLWTRKKDDGRAEAVLLADFGRRFY